MKKVQKSNKEDKKQPLMTLKEKREAKHQKKDAKNEIAVPFMPHR